MSLSGKGLKSASASADLMSVLAMFEVGTLIVQNFSDLPLEIFYHYETCIVL